MSQNRIFADLPQSWRIIIGASSGGILGMLIVLAVTLEANSYLNEKPEACANCHVMHAQYATWSHSAHRGNATCIDCHLPNDNLPHKLTAKGIEGVKDMVFFLLRKESNVPRASRGNQKTIQKNCIRCHSYIIKGKMAKLSTQLRNRNCWDCHKETPHGRIRGLPSVVLPQMQLSGRREHPIP